MNKMEKNDSRSLKREKLKSFLSERRSQKNTQAIARKETARRLTSERRARLISERAQARGQKEALKRIKIKSRVKINTVKSDKTTPLAGRPKSEQRKVFAGAKTQSDSGDNEAKPSSAPAGSRQAKNRQKLLSYLEKQRVKKSEIIAAKIKQKKAAAGEKQARRTERKRAKQSLSQPKPIIPVQKKIEAAVPAVIGQAYKRQQLLSYLKKRKAGAKTFAVQRRELKKLVTAVIPEVIPVPVVPEVIPVIVPAGTPPVVPFDTAEAVSEKVLVPTEEKPASVQAENLTDTAVTDSPKLILPPRKPFRIVPFLKAHLVKIIFLVLVLGWFAEIFMLNKRLESVRQQIEQAASIARPRVPSEDMTTAKTSTLALGTTRVEGIRDPFSNELWRIQEITPVQARSVGIRPPVKVPAPSSIIKSITPILITKSPEFTPPEVARAIPESAKLARIPQVTVPQVGSVSTPTAPVSSLRFRGILNVAGVDYFFVEGASGGYRVRIGDTVEGFKIYDYRNGVLYFSKAGYTYQLNEERASPPLRYRGRMIMAGQEYFFLEGKRTYRSVIGEEVEGYQLIKRVGDYLYFVKDDRLYYLKQE